MRYVFAFSYRVISVLALAVIIAPTCPAQELTSLDLTKIEARIDLRRPKGSPPTQGRYSGNDETIPCFDSQPNAGSLHTSLVALDRTHYEIDDEPTFEVTIENDGFTPLRIPFSPHLSDLQPRNPAQKFSYFALDITLWIASGERWSTNTGGNVTLYGANDHPDTMLTLLPGQWVRVVGKGHLIIAEFPSFSEPADHAFAIASLFREETLITPTQSATVSREVCLAKTRGQSLPIQLALSNSAILRLP
jgi:hypothetical protein